jgi:hypothetical protein
VSLLEKEEKVMSLNRFWTARGSSVLDAKGCSEGVFIPVVGHGKSPCFPRCRVLRTVGVGWRVLVSRVVDGGFFLD